MSADVEIVWLQAHLADTEARIERIDRALAENPDDRALASLRRSVLHRQAQLRAALGDSKDEGQ